MVRRALLAPNTKKRREGGGVACKWDENVSILSVGPAKAQVTRPSDALFGKLIMRTATDWVTRGHLTLYGWWLNVQSGQCKARVAEHCWETKRGSEKDISPNLLGVVVMLRC